MNQLDFSSCSAAQSNILNKKWAETHLNALKTNSAVPSVFEWRFWRKLSNMHVSTLSSCSSSADLMLSVAGFVMPRLPSDCRTEVGFVTLHFYTPWDAFEQLLCSLFLELLPHGSAAQANASNLGILRYTMSKTYQFCAWAAAAVPKASTVQKRWHFINCFSPRWFPTAGTRWSHSAPQKEPICFHRSV